MGMGGGAPPPRDIVVLLVILFVTFSLQFFDGTRALLSVLSLSPAVWNFGAVWQMATYAFVAQPSGGLWFLLTLLITFWFGRDVYRALGRKAFWRTMAWGIGSASGVAVLVGVLMDVAGVLPGTAFAIIQGEYILLTILIAAFATLYGNATILLFFVLPIRARYFLWLEIVIAFLSFLGTKDLPGFLGLSASVGVTYSILAMGGPKRALREWRLRIEKFIIEQKLKRMQSKPKKKDHGFRVIQGGRDKKGNGDPFGGGDGGGWVN